MSYIQLLYGVVNKEKQAKLTLPKNYGASQYFNRLHYLSDTNDPAFQNSIIDTLNSRADLWKYLLATSDYGQNIQENLNSVVTDGKLNDAHVRYVLDEKNKGVFNSSTPPSVTFKDAKKFDVQNPIIGNIISQVNTNQIRGKGVKELLARAQDEKQMVETEVLAVVANHRLRCYLHKGYLVHLVFCLVFCHILQVHRHHWTIYLMAKADSLEQSP